MKLKLIKILIIGIISGGSLINASALSLAECGNVIAHEDGFLNFLPTTLCHNISTCPKQVSAILQYDSQQPKAKQIHFVKISLTSLADGTWVISHNPSQAFLVANENVSKITNIPSVQCLTSKQAYYSHKYSLQSKQGYTICTVVLDKINSAQLATLQNYNLGIYRFKDYVAADPDQQMCFMLYFKSPPNINIINDLYNDGVNQRTLLESRNNQDAAWLHEHQSAKGPIYYTGRVGSEQDLSSLIAVAGKNHANYKNMWAIEVSYGDWNNVTATKQLVQSIKQDGYYSELDSMMYSLTRQEVLGSTCWVPLKYIGATMTMTSRPAVYIKSDWSLPGEGCLSEVDNNYSS